MCFVKPHKGIIRKNEHQIFTFKFLPREDVRLVEKCEFMLNYMKKSILKTVIVGIGEQARINLANNGILYFQPTCKNNSSHQTYEIMNATRTRINYEWKIPYECKNLFSVDTVESHLEPYERKVRIFFCFN